MINYCNAVIMENQLTLAERPEHLGPLRADFDFVWKGEGRAYDKKFLKNLAEYYQDAIREIADDYKGVNSDILNCIFLEKSKPVKTEEGTKDGFHLHFPKFICDAWTINHIRDKVIARTTNMGFWEIIEVITEPKKIVDNISRHPWMMYGSMNYKNENSEPYKYDKKKGIGLVLNGDLEEITLETLFEEEMSGREDDGVMYHLPRFLSIRGYTEATYLNERFAKIKKSKSSSRCRKIAKQRTDSDVAQDLKFIKDQELMTMLSPTRAEVYLQWMDVGWTLFNIGQGCEEALDMWIEFSQQRPESFKEGECEKEWGKMQLRPNKTISSLTTMAKIDNPEAYSKIINHSINGLIQQSLKWSKPTDLGISLVTSELASSRFKCVVPSRKIWYEFKDHRWHLMDGEVGLRKFIINEVGQKYMDFKVRLVKKQRDEYKAKDGKDGEDDYSQKLLKKCDAILESLQGCQFVTKVVTSCQLGMLDVKFFQKMDEQRNFLGCENGVLDFEMGCFREGRPDDNVTFTTGVHYRDYEEDEEDYKEYDEFMTKFLVNKSLRDYNIAFTARAIKGWNVDKKFLILTGPKGNNAKTSYISMLECGLGDYLGKFPRETIIQSRGNSAGGARPDLARVKGKRIMIVDEATKSEKLNMGVIKLLTGNDSFFARKLYADGSDIRPMFTLICQCNEVPSVPEYDKALWERIRLLKCQSKFVKPNSLKKKIKVPDTEEEQMKQMIFHADLEFKEKIPRLAPVLLFKLFRTAVEIDCKHIIEPKEVLESTSAYRKNNNIFHQFCKENITFPEKNLEKYVTRSSNMMGCFSSWYKVNYRNLEQVPRDVAKRAIIKCTGRYKPNELPGYDSKTDKWIGISLFEVSDEDGDGRANEEKGSEKEKTDVLGD